MKGSYPQSIPNYFLPALEPTAVFQRDLTRANMVTIVWGQGLSEDGRETFDSIEQARSMLEHDTDLSHEELDHLFETGKSTPDDSGFWIVVE